MCGIAGVARVGAEGIGVGAAVLAGRMVATLAHRGPDDEGIWESADGTVALAQRRLAIVDLSPLGHNPMPWDGGRLWITFNGEIYNFRDLRRELEAFGHRFRSQSDTEVILAAYDQWGIESVGRLCGMFAFALWDVPRQRLWLVRDRLGKKPLYYTTYGGTLRFASELKGLLADPDFPRDIDADALGMYLRYGYVPSPSTIYAQARKLPPAHYMVCEAGAVTVRRYWEPLDFLQGDDSRSDEAIEAELDSRLSTAVAQRRIADVPLGAFLSGGIDSSLIVALMQEQSGATPVKTFTIRFANPEFNEADHAAAVARHLGTEHHERLCDEREMLAVIDRLPAMFDEPFADSSAIPTYMVSRIAREHVTVALSGDGGDELFFGYPRYRYHATAARILALPPAVRKLGARLAGTLPTRRLRRIADVLQSDAGDLYSRFIEWFSDADIAAMTGHAPITAPMYADASRRLSGLRRELRPAVLDLVSYLPEDILTKVDRASMAVSLEARAPLLDHRVVEYALALPLRAKWRNGSMKWVLKRLLNKRVPQALTDRPKMGFGVPLDEWFRGPLRERMRECLSGTDLEDLGLDPAPARRMWAAFENRQRCRTDLLWQIWMLLAWSRASKRVPLEPLIAGAH